MLDQIPLGSTWRKMPNCNCQTELVCKSLQSNFPSPDSWSVSAPAITFDQQAIRSVVFVSPNGHPPRPNGFDDKRRCFSRNPYNDKAFVVLDVVDAEWNCSSVCPPDVGIGWASGKSYFMSCSPSRGIAGNPGCRRPPRPGRRARWRRLAARRSRAATGSWRPT